MPIHLKNSVYIHIPKTAGRHISGLLRNACKVTKDHTKYEAHLTPDLDIPVFTFVRHPAMWVKSLWCHRKLKGWNWDTRFELEKKCKATDIEKFISNICLHENILFRYFNHYTEKYDINCGKIENLTEDLINILDSLNEPYDKDYIIKYGPQVRMAGRVKVDNSKIDFDSLYRSQNKLYEKYQYSKIC